MKLRSVMRETVATLPVFDTHTHLVGGRLLARDFWEIGEYFWLRQELAAAGYPAHAEQLPEAERFAAYARALDATRNTAMAWCLRRLFRDLYDLDLEGVEGLQAADEAVRAYSESPDQPRRIAQRAGVDIAVTNVEADQPFAELPHLARCVPRLEGVLRKAVDRLVAALDRAAAGEAVRDDLDALLASYAAKGYPGVMTSESPFGRLRRAVPLDPPRLGASADTDDLHHFVLHALCASAERHGLFVQFFLGMESEWPGGVVPVSFGDRIAQRHGLFRRYAGPFDLVQADGGANLDVVQAAHVFPNVRPGGLWWYNFRPSTYRATLAMRIEAIPPRQCSLVASDARCLEWCYAKIALVKVLLADFLAKQVDAEWLSFDDALWVAQEWLHDSPARLHAGPSA
jgi:glucuronate isomerase